MYERFFVFFYFSFVNTNSEVRAERERELLKFTERLKVKYLPP